MERKCCHVGCGNRAEVEIAYSDDPPNTTDACIEHIGFLLSDAPRHSIVRVSEAGETLAEHCRLN